LLFDFAAHLADTRLLYLLETRSPRGLTVSGVGSDFGYQSEPAPTYNEQGYPVRDLVPFEPNADANARMLPSGSYCVTRRRSGEPWSGTFIGDDGRRHPC
jgi:hypothetical protein